MQYLSALTGLVWFIGNNSVFLMKNWIKWSKN